MISEYRRQHNLLFYLDHRHIEGEQDLKFSAGNEGQSSATIYQWYVYGPAIAREYVSRRKLG